MNGYICFYQSKRIELTADSLYQAKLKAIELLKVPKSKQGLLSVNLAEVNNKTVIHSTTEL